MLQGEERHLKRNIRIIIQTSYEGKMKFGELTKDRLISTEAHHFIKLGMLMKMETFENNKLIFVESYKYDTDNKLISTIDYVRGGNLCLRLKTNKTYCFQQ